MQTKLQSLTEVIINYLVGFIIGTISNIFVLPLFGYDVGIKKGLYISIAYTLISIVRSYVVRRIFNKKHRGMK